MSVSRHKRTHVSLAFAFVAVAAVTACDRSATAPATVSPIDAVPLSIEGDTLSCTKGWIIMDGRYVCNEDG